MKDLTPYREIWSRITRSRTPFQIEQFVIAQKGHEYAQFRQILIEAEEKDRALLESEDRLEEMEIESKRIRSRIASSERELLRIDSYKKIPQVQKEFMQLERQDQTVKLRRQEREIKTLKLAQTGARKELADLCAALDRVSEKVKSMTEEDLQAWGEKDAWIERLSRQCFVDIIASGRIGAGNLETIIMLPKEDLMRVMLDASRKVVEFKTLDLQVNHEITEDARKRLGHGKSAS